jgi:hypothetical protein
LILKNEGKTRITGKTEVNRKKPRHTTRDAGGDHKRGSQNRNKNYRSAR